MIKLYEIGSTIPETRRFQRQLRVDKYCADFIFENDKMYFWGGDGWVEFNCPYEIVTDRKHKNNKL